MSKQANEERNERTDKRTNEGMSEQATNEEMNEQAANKRTKERLNGCMDARTRGLKAAGKHNKKNNNYKK